MPINRAEDIKCRNLSMYYQNVKGLQALNLGVELWTSVCKWIILESNLRYMGWDEIDKGEITWLERYMSVGGFEELVWKNANCYDITSFPILGGEYEDDSLWSTYIRSNIPPHYQHYPMKMKWARAKKGKVSKQLSSCPPHSVHLIQTLITSSVRRGFVESKKLVPGVWDANTQIQIRKYTITA